MLQETICLLEQVRNTSILGLAQKLEVGLFVVGLESLQTLLGGALDTLLLFLLDVLVCCDHGTAELLQTHALSGASFLQLCAVLADSIDKLVMLLLLLGLACIALLLL